MKELGGWWSWLQNFSVFWKYFWPGSEPWLQSTVIFAILLAFAIKISTILSSYYLGLLVTELSEAVKRSKLRSAEVLPLCLGLNITYASTTPGAIPDLRSYLYMKVKIFRSGKLHRAFHRTAMSLDFSFHNTINPPDIRHRANHERFEGAVRRTGQRLICVCTKHDHAGDSATFLIRNHRQFMALDLLVLVVGYFIAQRRTAKNLPKELDDYYASLRNMEAYCRESIRC